MLLHAHVCLDYAAQSAVLKDNVSAVTHPVLGDQQTEFDLYEPGVKRSVSLRIFTFSIRWLQAMMTFNFSTQQRIKNNGVCYKS
ncbi:hypothetical protein Peur_029997 [Populus x canadensis]